MASPGSNPHTFQGVEEPLKIIPILEREEFGAVKLVRRLDHLAGDGFGKDLDGPALIGDGQRLASQLGQLGVSRRRLAHRTRNAAAS